MRRKITLAIVSTLGGLGVLWGLCLFLGATHGVAVRRSHISLGKSQLSSMQWWLTTNRLDTNYLAQFKVVPWTNTYTVGGRTYQSFLRTDFAFEGQGELALTGSGAFLFVYRDPSQTPRLVDKNYSPPLLPSWKY